jgi:hypothetical protein
MIHDNYTIIKLQQNPKNHRPKNKTAPTFNKKPFFSKKKSKIENHFSKVEIRKNKNKLKK